MARLAEVNLRCDVQHAMVPAEEMRAEAPTLQDRTNVLTCIEVDARYTDVARLHSREVIDDDSHGSFSTDAGLSRQPTWT